MWFWLSNDVDGFCVGKCDCYSGSESSMQGFSSFKKKKIQAQAVLVKSMITREFVFKMPVDI